MFAQYLLADRRKKPQYLSLSTLYFECSQGNNDLKIPLDDLAKVIIEKRRKLAPLVIGGIITSLSLLSIFLYSQSLEIIILVAFGLLLTYYGLFEYTVIHIEHANNTSLLWLPTREKIEYVRPFVAMLEYYINRKRFPVLYASPLSPEDSRLVHYESNPVKARSSILYQFGLSQTGNIQQIAINPVFLDQPIIMYGEGKIIARGEFLINQTAIATDNSINIS